MQIRFEDEKGNPKIVNVERLTVSLEGDEALIELSQEDTELVVEADGIFAEDDDGQVRISIAR